MRVEHRHQGLPEAVDVEEGAGLLAQAKLPPGQHLEHFVQRAETAGQGDESVGEVEHPRLAFVHAWRPLPAG
jgi:hypothetical protein